MEAPVVSTLSPALCRLLNAALVDASFREELLRAPRKAATRAALAPERAFGCPLPDPTLRLPPIYLDASDWDAFGRVRPTTSLADMCRQLIGGGPAPDSPAAKAQMPQEPEWLDARERWAAAG